MAQASATARSGAHRWEPLGTLLDAGELSGAAGGRTITINNPKGGYATAALVVDRTRSAGTDLTMTCTGAVTDVTPTAVMGTCTYDAAGVCTFVQATMQSTADASEVLLWYVDIRGLVVVDCVFDSTSADGDDELTVIGAAVTQ